MLLSSESNHIRCDSQLGCCTCDRHELARDYRVDRAMSKHFFKLRNVVENGAGQLDVVHKTRMPMRRP